MSDQEEMYELAEVQNATPEEIKEIIRLHRSRLAKREGDDDQGAKDLQVVFDGIRSIAGEYDDDLVALTAVFADPRGGYADDLGDALMLAVVVQAAGFRRSGAVGDPKASSPTL